MVTLGFLTDGVDAKVTTTLIFDGRRIIPRSILPRRYISRVMIAFSGVKVVVTWGYL